LIKYNPHGWRFYQKPAGPELYFLKPELSFTFFLLFFLSRMFLISFFGKVLMEMAINTPKHRKEQEKVVPLFRGHGTFSCG
jgi:hypothetical protein